MTIIKKTNRHYTNGDSVETMASLENAIAVLSRDNEYVDKVLECFSVDRSKEKVIQIGNVKNLLEDISILDSMAEKKDVRVKVRDIVLDKMLEEEAALFTLYGISDLDLVKKLHADHIQVESRYSAKNDVLEIHKLGKFANFCRDNKWSDLLDYINEYIRNHTKNDEFCSARLIRPIESDRYLLRAVTSDKVYRNYGINFSVLVALLSVNRYAMSTKSDVFIDNYQIDDSRVYLSFRLGAPVRISDNLELSFSLILENDEIKDSSVSFSGVFQLMYTSEGRNTNITLRPNTSHYPGEMSYNTDMLTYTHSMSVEKVYDKISNLPLYIIRVREKSGLVIIKFNN